MNHLFRALLFTLTSILLLGCENNENAKATSTESSKKLIVCTTSIVRDAVQNLLKGSAEEYTEVRSLMGPGVDPHLYKATKSDLDDLSEADIIIYNGLFLEGKMDGILKKLSRSKTVIPMAEVISSEKLIKAGGHEADPHVWFDVSLWAEAVSGLSKELQKALPGAAEAVRQNESSYISELNKLHLEVGKAMLEIPEKQRVLITSHDAFGYFGKAYRTDVKGIQGISTSSEPGLRTITEMTDFIAERGIGAVFTEASVSEKHMQSVVEGCKAKGHEVNIGGSLFTDALGESSGTAGTYKGMVRENVRIISAALK